MEHFSLSNIKLPIAVIGVIVAQAFGLIWYVANLDSTVRGLDDVVNGMQERMTDTSIAVLETNVQNIENSMFELKDKIRQVTDNPKSPEHFHDQLQHFHPEYDAQNTPQHFHPEYENTDTSIHYHPEYDNISPVSLDGIHAELSILKEALYERKQETTDVERRVMELEKTFAVVDNEMRTIMADHMIINDILRNLGQTSYTDNREYGNYD